MKPPVMLTSADFCEILAGLSPELAEKISRLYEQRNDLREALHTQRLECRDIIYGLRCAVVKLSPDPTPPHCVHLVNVADAKIFQLDNL